MRASGDDAALARSFGGHRGAVSCAVFLAAAGDGGDWCRAAAILLPAAMLVAMMAPLLACLSRLVLVPCCSRSWLAAPPPPRLFLSPTHRNGRPACTSSSLAAMQ
jgi:hypothetical protein